MQKPIKMTSTEVLERFETFYFDASGVLVDEQSALKGASEFLGKLQKRKKEFLVLTNGSSNSPDAAAVSLSKKGIHVAPELIVTAGSLVGEYLLEHSLDGADVLILGPESADFMLEKTKCRKVELNSNSRFDALVIADQSGFDLLSGLNQVISKLMRMLDQGHSCELILPNPDLIYPDGPGEYKMTSGSLARCIESALALRFPEPEPKFVRLGKPFSPIFRKARTVLGGDHPVMLGDQIYTDVLGARDAGISSVLLGTGLTDLKRVHHFATDCQPDYILESFQH